MRAQFPVTVHLFFFRENQILLLRRFNTGFRDGEYSVPAGHLDGGETVMQAAVREAKEEVGVRIAESDLAFSTVMPRIEGDERVDFSYRSINGRVNRSTPNLKSVMIYPGWMSMPCLPIPFPM